MRRTRGGDMGNCELGNWEWSAPLLGSSVGTACHVAAQFATHNSELRAKRPLTGIACLRTERFFDAQQLVVLRDAVAAAGRAGFDLSRGGAHRQVGARRV